MRQCETIHTQQDAKQSRHKKLVLSILEFACVLSQSKAEGSIVEHGTIHKPHSGDESHGAKHTDWREVLHRVQAVVLQYRERRGVGKRERRHVESHTYGVETDEQGLVGHGVVGAERKQAHHKHTCYKMANTQQSLGLDKSVGHYTHQCGHEYRHNALDGIEP